MCDASLLVLSTVSASARGSSVYHRLPTGDSCRRASYCCVTARIAAGRVFSAIPELASSWYSDYQLERGNLHACNPDHARNGRGHLEPPASAGTQNAVYRRGAVAP